MHLKVVGLFGSRAVRQLHLSFSRASGLQADIRVRTHPVGFAIVIIPGIYLCG